MQAVRSIADSWVVVVSIAIARILLVVHWEIPVMQETIKPEVAVISVTLLMSIQGVFDQYPSMCLQLTSTYLSLAVVWVSPLNCITPPVGDLISLTEAVAVVMLTPVVAAFRIVAFVSAVVSESVATAAIATICTALTIPFPRCIPQKAIWSSASSQRPFVLPV